MLYYIFHHGWLGAVCTRDTRARRNALEQEEVCRQLSTGERQEVSSTQPVPTTTTAAAALFRFVLVCGHITFTSMENFLKDFLHEDRVSSDSFYDADVLIVDK